MDIKWLQTEFPDLSNFTALAPSGQKEVFAADHTSEGSVVLKIFKPGSNAERIEREMRAPLQINSHRVPKVAELGRKTTQTGEIVWLRERKIDGQSLKELLSNRKTLTVPEVVRIALHVTEVLTAAETVKIVHRDIKPGNLIISPDGSAWVIDFGLARHLSLESVTPTADPFAPCTPGYAPVEQFTNQKNSVDGRCDLFSLGVTLYECLEGTNPFRAGTFDPHVQIDRVRNSPLPRVSSTVVPMSLVDFIEALTRTKVEHRPSTVAEAFNWITEIANEQGIS